MPKSKPIFLWITDPWDTLDHGRDTTLRLAEEAILLGYESHWCDVRSIRLENGKVLLESAPLSTESRKGKRPFPARISSPSQFSSLHYRVDPPVDLAYTHPLQLLILDAQGSPARRKRVTNPAELLISHNEKIEATLLKDLMPQTLVSSQWGELLRFGKSQRKTVIKPMHEAQSKGVKLLSWNSTEEVDENRELIAEMTSQFSLPVLLQQYLPGISEGEQRLWFLDGSLLACAKKMPLKDDFRVNIDQGSSLRETTLSPSEKASAREIGKYLKSAKIRLAAVDLIEGFVTDFNFTSPGLITQMESVLKKNLARPIIKALVKPPKF